MMGLSRYWRKTLTVFFVFLLVLQLVALPLHEYNLIQQGYTLVRVPMSQWSLDATVLSVDGDDFYNVAHCETHFLIQTLTQYEQLVVGLAVLAGLLVVLGSRFLLDNQLWVTAQPLTSISLRAPPLTPPV